MRFDFFPFMQSHSEKRFRTIFRMSKDTFIELYNDLSPHLERDEQMGAIGSAGTIAPETCLAVTIRMLSGAKVHDLSMLFSLGVSTTYEVFHRTCEVIVDQLTLVGIPEDTDSLRDLSLAFSSSRSDSDNPRFNPLHGCVGAVDGLAIKIRKPDVPNPAHYYNRKGFYAIPATVAADSHCRILTFSANTTGSTHDATAFRMSNLGNFIEEGRLPPGFWIAGDEAYPASESIIVPFPGSTADVWQDSFNFYLSSLRIHVEQTFGLLKKRWSILESELTFSIDHNVTIVCAAMKLHNFCVEQSEWYLQKTLHRFPLRDLGDLKKELDEWIEKSNTPQELEKRSSRIVKSRTRDRLVEAVFEKDLLRPLGIQD